MKLVDLRKLAIRRQTRIRFPLRNGMECVITEQGVAQVPALKGVPDFNLEEELTAASSFLLDPAGGAAAAKKNPARPRAIGREELAVLAGAGESQEPGAHEEE